MGTDSAEDPSVADVREFRMRDNEIVEEKWKHIDERRANETRSEVELAAQLLEDLGWAPETPQDE